MNAGSQPPWLAAPIPTSALSLEGEGAEDLAHRPSHIPHRPSPRHRGLSLVEMLVSLAITAMLLTATMVAIDASFRAYASAAETASRQTTTRLVVHRLVGLVRTSTAHGPLLTSSDADWPVTSTGTNTLASDFIELIDDRGNFLRIEYRSDENTLWLIREPHGGGPIDEQPLLGGVRRSDYSEGDDGTEPIFRLHRRLDDHDVWVLERGSMTMKVERDQDNTLTIESGSRAAIDVVASTMPRKLE